MAVPLPGVSEGPAKPLTYICCSLNQGCPHINPTWFIGRASSWEEVQISLQRSGRDKAQSLLNCSPGSNGGCSADSSAGKTGKPRRERMNEGRSLQRYAAIWVLAASLPERKTTCKNGGGCCKFKVYPWGPLRIVLSSLLAMSSKVPGWTERKDVVKKQESG